MYDPTFLFNAIVGGQADLAATATEQALALGVDPQVIVDRAMVPAMDEVGRRFENCEYFVPELLIAARAMKAALKLIRPLLTRRGERLVGRLAIGTVRGDLHDIGKSLVAAMLEGAGFEVIDLGVDAMPEAFVQAVTVRGASLVGLSALLTTTMPAMRVVIEALEHAGVRTQVKVIVGGAPVTEQFAAEIGADGYAPSAAAAVPLVRRLSGL